MLVGWAFYEVPGHNVELVVMAGRRTVGRLGRGPPGARGGLSSGRRGGVVGAETTHIQGVKSMVGESGLGCRVLHC